MRIILSCFLLSLISCGRADLAKSVKAVDGKDGISCSVQNQKLVCDDGTSLLLAAESPGNGVDWDLIQNQDGSVTIVRPGKPNITIGAKGNTGATGTNGTNGTNGSNGKDGKDGKDACTPKFWLDAGNCVWVQCGDKTEKIGQIK